MFRYWHHHWQPNCSFCRHRVHCEHSCRGQWQRVPCSLLCEVMAGGGQRVHLSTTPTDNKTTRRQSKSTDNTASSTTRKHREPKTSVGATHSTESDKPAPTGIPCSSSTPPSSKEAETNTTKNETAGRRPPPESPPPTRPSQSLYTTALRETPLFVKHEAIQTTPSKAKTRSAFAVIRTDGESTGRSPGTEDDTKSKQPPTAAKDENNVTDHHHQCHHHHRGLCWAAYHHCRQMCRHAWPLGPQDSKEDKKENDTTCAGFFINISKDDWGALLKEAWNRIKGMIQRSGGTILLDNAPSAPGVGESTGQANVTIGESVRWYDAHCAHQKQRTEYCSCAFNAPHEGCLHAHKCCQSHPHFQQSPNQFYDSFECQVSSSHQY